MDKKEKDTDLVRVDTKIKEKVVAHVAKTRQSIGGFYDLAAKEKLEKEKNKK